MTNLYLGLEQGLAKVDLGGGGTARWVLEVGPLSQVAVDPLRPDRVYAVTLGRGLWRSEDAGATWEQAGAGIDSQVTRSVAVSRSERAGGLGVVYVGTELSALYRSEDGGDSFQELTALQDAPSLPEWSFPPEPDTHHVHQILPDPNEPGTILVGIEQGGIMRSVDGGRSFEDHVDPADYDPHTLLAHPDAPGRVYEGGGVSYCESRDGGASWRRDLAGIPDDVRYFYSLAVDPGDPETLVISAARDPFSGHAVFFDAPVWSTLYRRADGGDWQEVTDGLPDRDGTVMGTLATNEAEPGVFYYVTVPGEVYRSQDGGRSWDRVELEWPSGLSPRAVSAVVAAEG